MKTTKTTITLEKDNINISRNIYKDSTYLSFCSDVVYDPLHKRPSVDSRQNFIRIPSGLQNKVNSKYCTLVNLTNGLYIDVIIDNNPSKQESMFEITDFIERNLEANTDSKLILCNQNNCEFNTVKTQRLENIKDDIVVLPKDPIMKDLLKKFSLFEIINPLTGDSIFVRSKYITFDASLKSNEIRINRKQRNMLNDNIPSRLSFKQWDELIQSEVVDENIRKILIEQYSKDGTRYTIKNSIDELPYDAKRYLQQLNKSVFGEKIIIKPVLDSFHYEKKKQFYRFLSDVFVGKSTLSLSCRRPHECDENMDVVRMSETNMQILGIEPMDKVIIQYKEATISCHVLPFNEEKFEHTNIPGVIELAIGIPAHIRNKLKMTDIQSSVKVDRDTVFIFKKSFNEQLVPIILTLLSLNFFAESRWYVSLIIILILIPIVMYITLSSKRNMRGK